MPGIERRAARRRRRAAARARRRSHPRPARSRRGHEWPDAPHGEASRWRTSTWDRGGAGSARTCGRTPSGDRSRRQPRASQPTRSARDRDDPPLPSRAAVRDRQGRGRQDDGRRSRSPRRPPATACACACARWPTSAAPRRCYGVRTAPGGRRARARGAPVGDHDRPGAARWRSGRPSRSARAGSSASLTRSDAFSAFVHAAPGARELVAITKAWELGRRDRWVRGVAHLRPRRARRARQRARPRDAAHAAHVRRDRARRADRLAGQEGRLAAGEPVAQRDGGRRAARPSCR